jgi:hypothetical protein
MGYEKFSFYTFLTHSKPPNHSRPVTRPAIFRGQIFFKKAGFLKTGLVQGRRATVSALTHGWHMSWVEFQGHTRHTIISSKLCRQSSFLKINHNEIRNYIFVLFLNTV